MANVNLIEAKTFRFKPRKKVAAYARVSIESDAMLHSLSAQVSHYSRMIQDNPKWQYAGVYIDDGITGTNTDNRKEFKRLIADCEKGKIELVLTKSVSRFARDTVDCLNTVRHLRDIGVEVYFEREHISTFDSGGELLLTLLAAFAQAESESISANVTWATRTRFQEGIQNGYKSPYGYYWDGEMYRTIPEQAAVVRTIFQRYLAGETAYGIAKELTRSGVKGQNGKDFHDYTVKDILSNYSYTGTQILQKNFMSDHTRKRNRGELPMYAVEDMFEPVISEEEYQKAQVIRQQRASERPLQEITRFSGLMRCGSCGCGVSRRSHHDFKNWNCNNRERNGIQTCDTRPINEIELKNAAIEAFGEISDSEFRSLVRAIFLFNDRIEFRCFGGKLICIDRHYTAANSCNGFSGKIFCGYCGVKCRRRTWRRHTDERTLAKYWASETCSEGCALKRVSEDEIVRATDTLFGKENSEAKFAEYVKKAELYNDRIVFNFKTGEVKIWQRG